MSNGTSEAKTIAVRLVLCTSRFIEYFLEDVDDEDQAALEECIHDYLVERFERAFVDLILGLEKKNFQVYREMYVDTLTDEDYSLSVERDDLKKVYALIEKFHKSADAALLGVAEHLTEFSEPQSSGTPELDRGVG